MKAILEFTLPEEQEDYDYAVKGVTYSIVIERLDNFLRQKLKYESEKYTAEELAVYGEVRQQLWDLKNEYEV